MWGAGRRGDWTQVQTPTATEENEKQEICFGKEVEKKKKGR